MKRALILVLVGAVALTVGCVKGASAPPAPAADASATAAPAEAPAPAAVKPAAASVADLPDYPGAVRVAFSDRTETGKDYTRQREASWTSADPYAKVVEYYQKAIVDKGWTIAGTKTKTTEIEWQLTKGTSTGKVEIKDGAPVTVKIERKDR
jgi:hypothetical protein